MSLFLVICINFQNALQKNTHSLPTKKNNTIEKIQRKETHASTEHLLITQYLKEKHSTEKQGQATRQKNIYQRSRKHPAYTSSQKNQHLM